MTAEINPKDFMTRVDSEGANGYWVEIPNPVGETIREAFEDKDFGGKFGALRAAKAFVIRTIERLPPPANPEPTEKFINNRKTIRIESGVDGISLRRVVNKYSDYYAWEARQRKKVTSNQRPKTVRYSIPRYGYEIAFMMAVKYRYNDIGRPVPDDIVTPDITDETKKFLTEV